MAFNVSEFRSQMQFDGARANLFDVEMNFPSFANPGNASRKLQFQCKSAQLPGSTVGIVPVQYFGREIKFAGNRTFVDWTVNVMNDEDFVVRNAMERWMNAINTHRGNLRLMVLTQQSDTTASVAMSSKHTNLLACSQLT
jgi:hypothetical protein